MLANVSQCLRTTVTELACRLCFFFLVCFGVFLLLKVHRRLNFHKALPKVNLTRKHNNREDAKRYLLKSLSRVVNFLFGKQFLYRLTSPCHPASPPFTHFKRVLSFVFFFFFGAGNTLRICPSCFIFENWPDSLCLTRRRTDSLLPCIPFKRAI